MAKKSPAFKSLYTFCGHLPSQVIICAGAANQTSWWSRGDEMKYQSETQCNMKGVHIAGGAYKIGLWGQDMPTGSMEKKPITLIFLHVTLTVRLQVTCDTQ